MVDEARSTYSNNFSKRVCAKRFSVFCDVMLVPRGEEEVTKAAIALVAASSYGFLKQIYEM